MVWQLETAPVLPWCCLTRYPVRSAGPRAAIPTDGGREEDNLRKNYLAGTARGPVSLSAGVVGSGSASQTYSGQRRRGSGSAGALEIPGSGGASVGGGFVRLRLNVIGGRAFLPTVGKTGDLVMS